MVDVVTLLLGGALLYFGAEWFVGGAAGLARVMGVRTLLIGLTVVAYGTSAPEVVVGVSASLGGHGDIALGNVLGSNVANVGLILGLTALIRPTPVDGSLRKREVPVLVASALLAPLVMLDGEVSRLDGLVLLALGILYTAWMVRSARAPEEAHALEAAAATAEAADRAGAPSSAVATPDGEPRPHSRLRLALTAAVGLGVLVAGGELFVRGASAIAASLGVSERMVGLTVVAIGTSLPELATSLIAAHKNHPEIAIGNVVGSNIFNVVLCLALAAIARPIGVSVGAIAVDIGAMVALTILAAFLLRSERRITRLEGAVLLLSYAAFINVLALE